MKGRVLDATEEDLEELISLIDQEPKGIDWDWFVRWAQGRELYIRSGPNSDEEVPATIRAVIRWISLWMGEEDNEW